MSLNLVWLLVKVSVKLCTNLVHTRFVWLSTAIYITIVLLGIHSTHMRSRLLLHYSQPNGEMYDSENGSDIWCGCLTVSEITRNTDIVIIAVYGSQSLHTSRNFIFPPVLRA